VRYVIQGRPTPLRVRVDAVSGPFRRHHCFSDLVEVLASWTSPRNQDVGGTLYVHDMADVRAIQVTFDCADPQALGMFWNQVLGYETPPPPPGFESWAAFTTTLPQEERGRRWAAVDPEGAGPRLFFQRVPEPKTVKNRVHLDVRAAPGLQGAERMAALDTECERLVALGATQRRRVEPKPPMEAGFIVMADPEGNEFCLD
jgi:hypothetical protein